MDRPHNFHIHDVQFQVAADRRIAAAARARRLEGHHLPAAAPARSSSSMRFADYSRPRTQPYMYHCHLLWHEDHGMMGQFVVVKPGPARHNDNRRERTP